MPQHAQRCDASPCSALRPNRLLLLLVLPCEMFSPSTGWWHSTAPGGVQTAWTLAAAAAAAAVSHQWNCADGTVADVAATTEWKK